MSDEGPSWPDRARWILAVLVVVAGAAYYLLGVEGLAVCQESVNARGDAISLCGPPRTIDLLPFALVAGVLLWPDLNELAVTGVFTLRRRVDQQEERQAVLEGRLIELNQRFMQITAMNQSQSADTHVNVYPDQQEIRRGLNEKDERTPGSGFAPAERSALPSNEPPAALLGQFLLEYQRIEPYVQACTPTRTRFGTTEVEPGVRARASLFRPELEAVHQTRNALIHDPHAVSPESLRTAVENLRYLKRLLDP